MPKGFCTSLRVLPPPRPLWCGPPWTTERAMLGHLLYLYPVYVAGHFSSMMLMGCMESGALGHRSEACGAQSQCAGLRHHGRVYYTGVHE